MFSLEQPSPLPYVDSFSTADTFLFGYTREYNPDGTEKHVVCEGARYHVTYWNTAGTFCSEPNCEMNKQRVTTIPRL